MEPENPLAQAVEILEGKTALGEVVGCSRQAVSSWLENGRLPASDHIGTTRYAEKIEAATNGEVSAEALIDWSKRGWSQPAA